MTAYKQKPYLIRQDFVHDLAAFIKSKVTPDDLTHLHSGTAEDRLNLEREQIIKLAIMHWKALQDGYYKDAKIITFELKRDFVHAACNLYRLKSELEAEGVSQGQLNRFTDPDLLIKDAMPFAQIYELRTSLTHNNNHQSPGL